MGGYGTRTSEAVEDVEKKENSIVSSPLKQSEQ